MKLQRRHRQLIVLAIGIIIIIFGLLQAVLKLEIDRKITDEVTFVLMIIAVALLFTKDKKKSEDDNIAGAEKGNDMTEPDKHDGREAANADPIIEEKESADDNE